MNVYSKGVRYDFAGEGAPPVDHLLGLRRYLVKRMDAVQGALDGVYVRMEPKERLKGKVEAYRDLIDLIDSSGPVLDAQHDAAQEIEHAATAAMLAPVAGSADYWRAELDTKAMLSAGLEEIERSAADPTEGAKRLAMIDMHDAELRIARHAIDEAGATLVEQGVATTWNTKRNPRKAHRVSDSFVWSDANA